MDACENARPPLITLRGLVGDVLFTLNDDEGGSLNVPRPSAAAASSQIVCCARQQSASNDGRMSRLNVESFLFPSSLFSLWSSLRVWRGPCEHVTGFKCSTLL